MLEIERGRHTRPVTPLENRLCPTCKVVESEIHFLLDCPSYEPFREELFKKIDSGDLYFKQLLPIYKFLYLTSTSNEQILKWFDELKKMDDMGFKTWITSVWELASRYHISLNSELEFDAFKKFAQMLWSRN